MPTDAPSWVGMVPAFLVLSAVLFAPGWLVVRALGARGLEALAVAPAVSVGVVAASATLLQRVGVRWGWLPLLAVTAIAAGIAWLVAHGLARTRLGSAHPADLTPARRLLGKPRPAAVAAIAIGFVLALVTILPAIGRPDELVDSPDAVYHLDRIRLFLETGNLSIANPTFYPNGFHSWIATGLLSGTADVLPGTNVATLVLAALVWPIGCVALVRHALGPSRLVTYAAGLASAAFVSFPTILLGWGVLWPNLMGTALTPGALALMLQAARSRQVGQWLGFVAALPGLALIQPNSLVALVVFALVWLVTARVRAGVLGHASWSAVGRDLGLVAALVAVGLLAAPLVSARLASTQSYVWTGRVSVWTALVEVVGGRLQIASVLWGLLLLLPLGIGWILLRARAAIPVVAMWLACVVLYVMAASSSWSWTALITGYWYNDKIRLAALAAVPGVVLVAASAPAVRALLRRIPALRARPLAAALVALAVIPAATVLWDHGARDRMLITFFRPGDPSHVILSREAQAQLRELSTSIPAGEGVVGRPENGTPLMFALFGTDTLYRSIPIPTTGDEIVIGTGFNDLVNRPDVCDALKRHNIRWAIGSPHVYWLDRPERSSGLSDLDHNPGVEKVRTVGDYTLYRITGC
ncbi:hypothetical protein N865_10175 [Intrasporangium oryzae NRRL B-24470]|uniref:Glycosyltransferase RgtA/B/C/D-like domain-containing protein n=1 Tax=Intrasporangium oryzae NRRL B-24470 TaxID=1386089 RepID=W9GCF3_9MICO|nr:DUF6541 family protein [Intrasporangium oryzae]EWT01504.1 hypothetical protein N865_10175 [Intrasporangium oryzae NRRL B-24470]